MEVKRLFDLLPWCEANFPGKPDVFAGKDNGTWTKFSIQDYREAADNISFGLLKLGVEPGDKIATIANNRPEWNFIDMGIMQAGAVHVPIYPTISDSDYEYILNHAEVKVIFVGSEDLYKRLDRIKSRSCCIQSIFSMKTIPGTPGLEDLITLGKENQDSLRLQGIMDSVKPHDMATMIYTSGTTGNPKGVMLAHEGIILNFLAAAPIPQMQPNARAISFLPLSHIYERMINYLFQYLGFSIHYVESLATIGDNIREVKPHIMGSVPRFIEKTYDKIVTAGQKLPPVKRFIFNWGHHLALHYNREKPGSLFYQLQLKLADKLVFSKWREALGGELSLIVSGGAALQMRLSSVFWAMGIDLLEGYGLTETSPVICVNLPWPGGGRFGTVGPKFGDVQVKIAEDGEVLCKGPTVMLGYYKNPELTKEVIDTDGWFHTGDLGKFEDGFLRIVGRKKEIFKTSFGKYVSPQAVEGKMIESQFIDQIIVLGENQKYAAALVVPNFEYLKSWCLLNHVVYTSASQIILEPIVRKKFKTEIDTLNKTLGATEQVKNFELLDKEWTQAGGELTASLKLKRRVIEERYADTIAKLFQ